MAYRHRRTRPSCPHMAGSVRRSGSRSCLARFHYGAHSISMSGGPKEQIRIRIPEARIFGIHLDPEDPEFFVYMIFGVPTVSGQEALLCNPLSRRGHECFLLQNLARVEELARCIV